MRFSLWLVELCVVAIVVAPACERNEPAILGKAQEIVLKEVIQPDPQQTSITLSARATSGLPIVFSTRSLDVCTVDAATGFVVAEKSGVCSIVINQEGNAEYSPALPLTADIPFVLWSSLVFASSPTLRLYDISTVRATGPTTTTIDYSSETPSVCSVDGDTGLVFAKSIGTCSITARSDSQRASQTIEVTAPESIEVPGIPTGVTASLAGAADRVSIGLESVASGGEPITEFWIRSVPPGVTGRAATLPTIVTCPSSCAGYAFELTVSNRLGVGPSSTVVEVISKFQVEAVHFEPDCQPNNSIFLGEYILNSSTRTVSRLRGKLSESMTGGLLAYPSDTMIWLPLEYQLSSIPVTLGGTSGLLVTSFLLNHTNTLSNNPGLGGTDGWEPGTGRGLYYGYPAKNLGNAYARIFVNTVDPLAQTTDEQLAKLAYADCTEGGMMGATCMTGTSVAGYGTISTMGGHPISQMTKQLWNNAASGHGHN